MSEKKDAVSPRRSLKEKLKDAARAHRRRHSSTGLQFVIADSIELIPGKAWDKITHASSVYLSRNYLRVLESAAPDGLSPRYAMVFDGKVPVVAIAAQLIEISGKNLISQTENAGELARGQGRTLRKVIKEIGQSAKKKAIAKIQGRLLVCGNLLSWGQHGLAFSSDYPLPVCWSAVAEALYRIRRAERLSGQTDIVMVKDFTKAEEDGISELRDFEYAPLETDPNMVLEIPAAWRTFEDYLGDLASKYRSGAKKIIKDVTNAGITLEVLSDVTPHAERIHQLYSQVHSKAAVRPVSIKQNYLPEMASAFGDDFRCTVARRGEEIVGFITTLKDGATCVGYYIGFDYGVNQETPLYFRLLQVCVEDAIRFGCQRLSFGRTALDPKARMGARPEPMRAWLRHRQPVLNWMVKGLLGAIPHDEAPDRNPFKTN